MAAASSQTIAFGPFEFDAASGLLYRGQHEILLPLRAAKLLEVLFQRAGEVLLKEELLGEVWKDAFVGEDSLTQAISMIRSALGDDPRDPTYIQTIPKRGYRFIAEVMVESGGGEEAPAEPVTTIPEGAVIGAGESLGHYEILDELGSGAMGVVYRARDTVLERDVAIKVLPEDFLRDPDRVARFEREAKLLAAVSHPNIAAIYSLEEADGTKFPVMELVEGETLEERLRSGPIRMEEALEIARQIASALEAAHERGIVHRDLKPANIKLTRSGQVKVLDFGLAKALNVEVFGEEVSESPTESITIMGFRRGSIVGTAAYMSPEQARGQEINKQADIWAFGCVLYEMLTGRRLFVGDTVSDTIAGVLERQPDWGALPAGIPRPARRLLRRCMAKDPRDRLRDIGDARLDIDEALRQPGGEMPESTLPVARPPLWRRAIPWSLAAIAASTALVVSYWASRSGSDVYLEMTRTSIVLPPEAPLAPLDAAYVHWAPHAPFVLSPDASKLVYVAWVEESRYELWVRDMQTGTFDSLPDTVGAYQPFFSPDGTEVGFFAEGMLKTISILGNRAQPRAEVVHGFGGTWGTDGYIYYVPDQLTGIHKVPTTGWMVETVTTPAEGEQMHTWPVFVAGRNELLYQTGGGVWRKTLETFDPSQVLIDWGASARYAPSGHLVYGLDGVLVASRMSLDQERVVDLPVVIFDDVSHDGNAIMASWSDNGTLVYVEGTDLRVGSLAWVDRSGVREPVDLPSDRFRSLSLSPDGSLLAFTAGDSGFSRLWLHEIDQEVPRPQRVTDHAIWPVWHPSSEAIFFTRRTPQGNSIFRVDLSDAGREPVEVVPAGTAPLNVVHQVLKEGLIYGYREESSDLWFVPFADDGRSLLFDERRKLTDHPGAEILARLSPDGHWLSYASNKGGQWEVYVASYPDLAGEERVSHAGGFDARWSSDGREIVYRSGRDWYSVGITDEPQLELASPVCVLTGPYLDPVSYSWDLSADGQRLLVLENPEIGKPITELVVITNFFQELKRLVPTEQ